MICLTLKHKLAVSGTPVINGFSYPFLSILILRVQELQEDDLFFNEKDSDINQPHGNLTLEAHSLIAHMYDQLKICSRITEDGVVLLKDIDNLLAAAKSFLNIFVATDAELSTL